MTEDFSPFCGRRAKDPAVSVDHTYRFKRILVRRFCWSEDKEAKKELQADRKESL
jgi:hypothetical protein